MKKFDKIVLKRRFERIIRAIEGRAYSKNEDFPENEEIFIYGVKQIRTDAVDNYKLIGCESDECIENDKFFNFWTNKFIDKEIEMKNFGNTVWFFMVFC